LILQETKSKTKAVRLFTHAYFEARLEERCEKSRLVHETFSVLRVHVEGEPDLRALEDALTRDRMPRDVVAAYAVGEYELLLATASKSGAEEIAKKIRAELTPFGISVRAGIASFPEDGRNADGLVEASCAALRGTPAARPSGTNARVLKDRA